MGLLTIVWKEGRAPVIVEHGRSPLQFPDLEICKYSQWLFRVGEKQHSSTMRGWLWKESFKFYKIIFGDIWQLWHAQLPTEKCESGPILMDEFHWSENGSSNETREPGVPCHGLWQKFPPRQQVLLRESLDVLPSFDPLRTSISTQARWAAFCFHLAKCAASHEQKYNGFPQISVTSLNISPLVISQFVVCHAVANLT